MSAINETPVPRQEIPAASGQSLPIVDDAIREGDLETFLVGRRRYAFPSAIARWLSFLKAESDAGRPVCYRARDPKKARAHAKRKAAA